MTNRTPMQQLERRIDEQQARIAELERERDEFFGWLQRYQPPGSPPPGAGYIQARWIVTELGRERDVWKGAAEQAVVELERERGGIAELLVDIGILEEGGNVEDAIAEGFANASRRENELEAERDALKCQVQSLLGNEVAAAEAEMKADRLRSALEQIRKTPILPFPDPGAHSARAFAEAVQTAWSRIQQIAAKALTGPAVEHPLDGWVGCEHDPDHFVCAICERDQWKAAAIAARTALENIKQNMANDRFVDPIKRKMYLGAIDEALASHPAGQGEEKLCFRCNRPDHDGMCETGPSDTERPKMPADQMGYRCEVCGEWGPGREAIRHKRPCPLAAPTDTTRLDKLVRVAWERGSLEVMFLCTEEREDSYWYIDDADTSDVKPSLRQAIDNLPDAAIAAQPAEEPDDGA